MKLLVRLSFKTLFLLVTIPYWLPIMGLCAFGRLMLWAEPE